MNRTQLERIRQRRSQTQDQVGFRLAGYRR
jgi:hypothetical protein